jgi:hypothetical protein
MLKILEISGYGEKSAEPVGPGFIEASPIPVPVACGGAGPGLWWLGGPGAGMKGGPSSIAGT